MAKAPYPATNLNNNLNLVGGMYYVNGVAIGGPQSIVLVQQANDLAGTIDSSKLYLVDGVVDMGDTQILVPEGGIVIHGLDFNISLLTTSEPNHKLFIADPAGSYAGDVILRDMAIEVSGAGSQVYDLDNDGNFGAVECTDFNFVNCTSLGELSNYRQGLWSDFGLIGCTDGLTMSGTWAGGFAILTAILVSAGNAFTGTVLAAGTGLSVNGSIRCDMNALQLDDAGTFSDFAPSNIVNDAEFRMIGLRVNENANAFPNMPASNVKARYANCVGTPNTYVGGKWSFTAGATTNILAVNTPEKMAGTTTYDDMQWFSNTTDNAFVYDGAGEIDVLFEVIVPASGGTGDEINVILRKWDDSASSYVDLADSGPITTSLFGGQASISAKDTTMLSKNDRLEVWIENQSDASDIDTAVGGIAIVSER